MSISCIECYWRTWRRYTTPVSTSSSDISWGTLLTPLAKNLSLVCDSGLFHPFLKVEDDMIKVVGKEADLLIVEHL
jgi:hypothetical protein